MGARDRSIVNYMHSKYLSAVFSQALRLEVWFGSRQHPAEALVCSWIIPGRPSEQSEVLGIKPKSTACTRNTFPAVFSLSGLYTSIFPWRTYLGVLKVYSW